TPDPAKWGQLALSLLPFAPVVDGTILPAHPLEAFAAGQAGGIPLMIGSNRDEARLFLVAADPLHLIDDAALTRPAGAYRLTPESPGRHPAHRAGGRRGGPAPRRLPGLVLPHPGPARRRGPWGRPRPDVGVSLRPPRARSQPPARRLPRRGDPVRVRHHDP